MRPKYACPTCKEGVATAALPPMPWLNEPLWKAPEEAARVFFPSVSYSLLGARGNGPGMAWSSEVSLAAYPVLGDHRIMGAVVLPGAASRGCSGGASITRREAPTKPSAGSNAPAMTPRMVDPTVPSTAG